MTKIYELQMKFNCALHMNLYSFPVALFPYKRYVLILQQSLVVDLNAEFLFGIEALTKFNYEMSSICRLID